MYVENSKCYMHDFRLILLGGIAVYLKITILMLSENFIHLINDFFF